MIKNNIKNNPSSLESLESRRLLSGTLTLDSTWGTAGFVHVPADVAAYTKVLDVDAAPNGKEVALALGNATEVVRYNSGGSVDTSFGVDGRFVLAFDATAIAVASDGSVVVAGSNTVLRLTATGDTDDTFGAGGFVTIPSQNNSFPTQAEDVRIRSDNSVVILRSGTTDGTTAAAIVTKLFSDGNINTSFGSSGTSTFALPIAKAGISNLQSLALSPTGDFVYFGGSGIAALSGNFKDTIATVVARASVGGTLDQGFQINDPSAIATTHLDGIEVTDLGDVLTVSDNNISFGPAIVHQFNVAGVQDASINVLTEAADQRPTAIAEGGDGKVLIGFNQPYAVARLVSDQIAPGIFLSDSKVLTVEGTEANDVISVTRSTTTTNQLRVTRDGKRTLIDRASVAEIELDGFAGNDVLTVTVAVPTLAIGDLGDDTITTGDANDTLSGGDGNDSLVANGGNDLLDGGVGADRLYGGSGADRLAGQGGKDRLYGGSGNDQIDGGAGDDQIFGQSGNDKLFGGTGNDLLDGDGGTNQYFPGAGSDTVLGT